MPRYAITEKAGRFVAGQNNTGVGSVLELTEKQAEYEVSLGTLQPLDVAKDEPAEPKTGKGKGKKAEPKGDGADGQDGGEGASEGGE